MKLLIAALGLVFLSISTAPSESADIWRCWHAKPPVQRNSSQNTGTHGKEKDAYYKRSGYTTRCRYANYNAAMNWASRCSKYYSRYFNAPASHGHMCY